MDRSVVADCASTANGAVWSTTSIATVLFALRIYSRVYLKPGSASWDDFFIVLGWVTASPCLLSRVPASVTNSVTDDLLDHKYRIRGRNACGRRVDTFLRKYSVYPLIRHETLTDQYIPFYQRDVCFETSCRYTTYSSL